MALTHRDAGRRVSRASLALAAMFLASSAARIYAAGFRKTPLYYPDEYIYSALSRSIASTGVPRLRGQVLHFSSLLAPYLMAPAWWIGNVSTAYHVVLDLGAVWFSAAVFPAYALARRLGISSHGSLIVALLTIVIPDAAFATNALTEPYAYPLFLTTILVAVTAIDSPSGFRQFGIVALMGLLCFARVQFAFVPLLYGVAVLVHSRGSVRRALRTQPVFAGAVILGLVFVAALGPDKLVGFYTFPTDALYSTWIWFGMNLFVLAVAAGWVVVPAAALGLATFARAADPVQRAFAIFTLSTLIVLGAQGAYIDALQHRVHERYTFYAAPLLIVACIWALESLPVRRPQALLAYALAAAAVLVPASASLHSANSDQSPTLLGLQELGGQGSTGHLVWALGLALAALAVGFLRSRRLVVVLGVVISTAICIAGTRSLIDLVPSPEVAAASPGIEAFRLPAPPHSALLIWSGTDRFTLMKTLFWSPNVDRVLVLGGGLASDGFAFSPVRLGAPEQIADRTGKEVAGPFAFAPDTTVAGKPETVWSPRPPKALILGLARHDGYLNAVAELFANADSGPQTVILELIRTASLRTLTFACPSGRSDVHVAKTPTTVRIHVGTSRATRCRISLTEGAAAEAGNRITSGVKVVTFTIANSQP